MLRFPSPHFLAMPLLLTTAIYKLMLDHIGIIIFAFVGGKARSIAKIEGDPWAPAGRCKKVQLHPPGFWFPKIFYHAVFKKG